MKPIFLIGYMGSGKSTLGLTVSRKLHRQFVDLDVYIENRFHLSIKELFNSRGEEAFRRIEQNMLHEVSDFENVIVSCGGGTPIYGDNLDYMNEHGTTVWLNASVPVLMSRLLVPSAKAKRPMLANRSEESMWQYVEQSLGERRGIYSRAKYEFNADKLESREQIHAATDKLAELILSTENNEA